MAGNKARRRGLMRVFGMGSGNGHRWRSCQAQYRRYLYSVGEESEAGSGERGKQRVGVSEKVAKNVERQDGHLGLAQVVGVRVRYFSDSLALGSEAFVEEVFARHRETMRVKRKQGARPLKSPGLSRWRGLVDLRGK